MKVPTIRLGIEIQQRSLASLIAGKVNWIDHRKQLFGIEGRDGSYNIETHYDPVPSLENFIIAIKDWDFHYRQSDDPKWFDLGEEYKKALKEMLKNMSEQDRHVIAKIVDIVGL